MSKNKAYFNATTPPRDAKAQLVENEITCRNGGFFYYRYQEATQMNEELQEVLDGIEELFKARRFAELREKLSELEPADIAIFLEERLDEKEQVFFFLLGNDKICINVYLLYIYH